MKSKEFVMSEATLTSKGQTTIPVDIRQFLGVQAQDRLSFTPMPDGTVVLRAKNRSLADLKGLLKPSPGRAVAQADGRAGHQPAGALVGGRRCRASAGH
jgi:antitoxin PrlF